LPIKDWSGDKRRAGTDGGGKGVVKKDQKYLPGEVGRVTAVFAVLKGKNAQE